MGKKDLNRIDMSYERAYMANRRDEYYRKMLETLIDHNDRHNESLPSEKLQQAVSRVMAETEEVECDTEHNASNMTMDTFLYHSIISPSHGDIENVTSVHCNISTPQEDANVTN